MRNLQLNFNNLPLYINNLIENQLMEQDGQPKVVKIQPPYYPTKYFISSLNTILGNTLVQRLRNDSLHPENPNTIIGTVIQSNSNATYGSKLYPVPQGVRKVIQTQKVQFFQDVILNSDVIIYNLTNCDLKEAQFVISTLKINPFESQKTLICISNVMTWAKSRPKQKKQGDQQQGDDNPLQEPDSQQEGGGEPAGQQGQQKKTYVRFTDKDYSLRRPHPQYQRIKSIQTLCLAAGSAKANLKTYVLCSGILYGAGQDVFQPYYMQARLQQPNSLIFYGNGKNRIPMVHIHDLATYIEKTIQKKPALPYIFALDHNPKPTQKKIIQAISKGIGTGKVSSLPLQKQTKNIDILTLNLRIKPTMYFAKLQQQEAAIQVQEGSDVVKFKFNWQSKDGVQKNIESLRKEFNHTLNLKQIKIFLMGPPGCGKTHYAKTLSQKYYLPHLHIKGIIEEVKSLQSQLAEQVRNSLAQKKESQVANKQQQFDQLKEKWKKIPKQLRQPLTPFNPDTVDVRLSDELVYKCYKWRLSQNDCLNRGYILDGYPKKYEDARQIFMGLPLVQEGQQQDENAKKILDERLAPTKFIQLDQQDVGILENLQRQPEDKIIGTHYVQKEAKRRLKTYRELMNNETGDFVLQDFFLQNKIQSHHIKVTGQTNAMLQSLIKPMQVSQSEQLDRIQQIVSNQKVAKQTARQEMTKKQGIIRNIQSEDYRMKKQNQQNEEREILDKKSLALRKYLDVNLVPILSQGIIEILKQFPKDPVDKLAQFLFKNSLKVPNPDPSTFEF